MTTATTTQAPAFEGRVLPSGRIVIHTTPAGRRISEPAEFLTCSWLVEVPTNNPEPDFPSDCWRTVECGARVTSTDGTTDRWVCDNGHTHAPYDEQSAHEAWLAEQFS